VKKENPAPAGGYNDLQFSVYQRNIVIATKRS
jgi:hypothetical protein